ncbi:hypothetical protein ACFFLM_26440 [Deinococcus oregonensis]|uniref:Fibronectin type-III domain-containing protein n=1 Tax=Deinococcus oregonensis TaxID=1805970 RepID=A0ABV6B6S4_9DEIO
MNAPTASRAAVSLMLALSLCTAGAWKPSTHVYIAEMALRDALDDGQVSVNILSNGQAQTPAVIRNYAVDPELLAAIRADPRQYRAGVVGPDAYPDIGSGQSVVHPGPTDDPRGIDANRWLQHLWNSSRNSSGAVKAFTAGFLTHASEDMFGHTMVDFYTDKKFTTDPPLNAAKHLVFEGYIGKRTPNILKYDRPLGSGSTAPGDYVTSDDLSIDGVQDFIYQTMVDAKPGTVLNNTQTVGGVYGGLYNSGGGEYAVPLIFSNLRGRLQGEIDEYYNHKADLIRRYHDCDVWDFSCSATALAAELAWYMATNSVQITYKEHWRADIDDGLRAWPALSHQLNRDLIFTSRGINLADAHMDTTHAKAVAQSYVYDHLISMMGAPDFVGWTAGLIDRVFGAIFNALQIAYFQQLKDDLVNQLVNKATGKSLDEWKEYATNPEQSFDQVMAQAPGATATLADVNTSLLRLNDNQSTPDLGYTFPERRFDLLKLPAAYNSLTLAKMVLLGPGEYRRLMADLGVPVGVPLQDNAALGYIDSFDGNNQWLNASSPFRTCGVFSQLFQSQIGGQPCATGVMVAPADPTNFSASADSSSAVSLSWTGSTGAANYTLERRSRTSSSYTLIASPTASSGNFYDRGRLPSASYTYRLRAVNPAGASAGVEVSVTMPDREPCRVAGAAASNDPAFILPPC